MQSMKDRAETSGTAARELPPARHDSNWLGSRDKSETISRFKHRGYRYRTYPTIHSKACTAALTLPISFFAMRQREADRPHVLHPRRRGVHVSVMADLDLAVEGVISGPGLAALRDIAS